MKSKGQPFVNKILKRKWLAMEREKHVTKMHEAKPVINISPPRAC